MRPISKRSLVKALVANECAKVSERGRHEKWVCSCQDAHKTAVPRHSEISPGVARNIINDLECLPEGWLQ
jgi:hypothetical protein